MTLEERDYMLLQWLNRSSEPLKIEELSAPKDVQANFQFFGLDKHKYPDSIWVRLFELSKFKFVREIYSGVYQITTLGKEELQKNQKRKNLNMVDISTLLRYFYKQNRVITVADLFQKFGVDDAILKPVNYLVNNDWVEENDGKCDEWKITEEGKKEFERIERGNNPQPAFNISGQAVVVNTGTVEGDIKVNIKHLNESGLEDVSKSIQALMDGINLATELNASQKEEYLETLKVLSIEAVKPKEQRLPTSTLKQIIQFGLGTLNAISSISTVTGINLANISNYFLL